MFDACNIDNPKSFPIVVLGNKSDLESERKVQKSEVEQWCRANDNITFYETDENNLKSME